MAVEHQAPDVLRPQACSVPAPAGMAGLRARLGRRMVLAKPGPGLRRSLVVTGWIMGFIAILLATGFPNDVAGATQNNLDYFVRFMKRAVRPRVPSRYLLGGLVTHGSPLQSDRDRLIAQLHATVRRVLVWARSHSVVP